MDIEKEIKQSKFDSEIEKVIVNIIFTYNALRDAHLEILKPHGILMQHYNVLRILRGKHPKSVCPGEIKAVMLDKGNDVTRLVDKLVSMGLVTRQLCEANRRKIDVNITEKGLELTKLLSQKLEVFGQKANKNISDAEAKELSSLLDKLRG